MLFGALAGTGVLAFSREQFEATIERGGVGVKPSLHAFGVAYLKANEVEQPVDDTAEFATVGSDTQPRDAIVAALVERVRTRFPVEVQQIVTEGVRRLIDYQDPDYAGLYLDRLAEVGRALGQQDIALMRETARHLALWMSYEDTIRVADLKTRGSRFERVRTEVRAQVDQLLAINEFMHPRIEEICETLPASLGRWLMRPHWVHRLVRRFTQEGRVVTTSSLRGAT